MQPFALKAALDTVRATTPLVHNITNYVTVNDCANALLAIGASPIMSDEPNDVRDIQTICGGLVLNIGTLNQHTIEGMFAAGERAAELGHPIVLDPVGAGASTLRTTTAGDLLDKFPIAVIRGNMSEVKALAGGAASTRGVDVCPDDAVTEDNLAASAAFARDFAAQTGAVVAITGAIDIVADANRAFAIRNGSALMGRITGAGCMLTCICAAFAVANPDALLESQVAAVAAMGLAGQTAQGRMGGFDGNGSFRTYLLDILFNLTGDALEQGAKVEELAH
ncbi:MULTISPECIES: hydroxyethylthiazole kinase [Gordonibacter]|uniref:Hydroxyethylthiazole kinase n=1 Tax=Gordonibacter faecis TaxID=3047475 RepID=A0ABT7DN66_9ACTN|nr:MULTISPECIES: hydroxyethylthiazole kinase [unclassified Gordonibacter]MDJ1650842.1 hydroxyethylthiazole kinase [Gordonibacter sp. KGMB12511]HIW76098.1 hydroxyethylthiazole kinase [Candidatus Gordonibacter avicola]